MRKKKLAQKAGLDFTEIKNILSEESLLTFVQTDKIYGGSTTQGNECNSPPQDSVCTEPPKVLVPCQPVT